MFSNSYKLPLDMALTKHGQERIDGDDRLKLSGKMNNPYVNRKQ